MLGTHRVTTHSRVAMPGCVSPPPTPGTGREVGHGHWVMPTGTEPAAPAAVLWSSLQGGAPSPGLVGTLTILPKQRCIST